MRIGFLFSVFLFILFDLGLCVAFMEKVLIIDDDKLVHIYLGKFLAGECEVRCAFGGEEGLQEVYAWRPDIILLDVEMPGRSGYDICDILKQNEITRETRVIFLSSNSSLRERMQGYEVGADDYLIKPCDHEELLIKIKIISQLSKEKYTLMNEASNAMEAMSASFELGKAIRLVERLYLTTDFDSLADCIMDFMKGLGLNSVVMFEGCQGRFYKSSTLLQPAPLEKELISMLRGQDRYVDFGSRTVVNFPQVVLLVKNMPLGDRAQYGRLKDIFPFILGAADAKVRVIDVEHALQSQNKDLTESIDVVQMTITTIRDLFKSNMTAVSSIMTELIETLSLDMKRMGLETDQEEYVCELVEDAADDVHVCLEKNTSIETNLSDVVALLSNLTEEQQHIIAETLTTAAPLEYDSKDDIELF